MSILLLPSLKKLENWVSNKKASTGAGALVRNPINIQTLHNIADGDSVISVGPATTYVSPTFYSNGYCEIHVITNSSTFPESRESNLRSRLAAHPGSAVFHRIDSQLNFKNQGIYAGGIRLHVAKIPKDSIGFFDFTIVNDSSSTFQIEAIMIVNTEESYYFFRKHDFRRYLSRVDSFISIPENVKGIIFSLLIKDTNKIKISINEFAPDIHPSDWGIPPANNVLGTGVARIPISDITFEDLNPGSSSVLIFITPDAIIFEEYQQHVTSGQRRVSIPYRLIGGNQIRFRIDNFPAGTNFSDPAGALISTVYKFVE